MITKYKKTNSINGEAKNSWYFKKKELMLC